MEPTLCRLPAYAGPGLPSPTTRCGSSRSPRPGSSVGGSRGPRSAFSVGSSRSMPASASASASSASSCSAVGAAEHRDDDRLGVGDQRRALRQRHVAGGDVVADAAGPRCRPRCGPGCAWPRPRRSACSAAGRPGRPGAASPVSTTGTSTVTFSPRRTRSRSTCSKCPLIGSRWIAFGRASSLAAVELEGEQHVGAAALSACANSWAGSARCAASCRARTGRRGLAGPAGAAGAALAELGAGLGGDADLGHGGTPHVAGDRGVARRRRTRARTRTARTRVDHGARARRPRRATLASQPVRAGVRPAAPAAGLTPGPWRGPQLARRRTGWSPSRRRRPRGSPGRAAARSRAR